MPKIKLAEPPFFSIQGEGVRIGRPTVFVRTYVCNLRCAHCDSKNSWGTGKFGDNPIPVELSELIEQVESYKHCQEVCITGGEPLMEGNGQFLKEFIWEMNRREIEVTIETAATIYNTKIIKSPVSLWSISPKYPCAMTGYVDWVNYKVLNAMIEKIRPEKMEIKLLISNEVDVIEAKQMLNNLSVPAFNKIYNHRIPVIIQPDCEANWTKESYKEGLEINSKTTAKEIPTTEQYLKNLRDVASVLMRDSRFRQFNLMILPQYHKLLGMI